MLRGYDVTVTGSGYYDVRLRDRFVDVYHVVAVHRCLQSANRIDFCYHNTCTCTAQRIGRTFSYVAISANHSHFTGHHHISSSADCVHQTFFTTVFVIEFALGNAIVYVDRRDVQSAFRHTLIQTVNTGGGFFTQTFDTSDQFRVFIKHHVGQIAAIIQNHVQGLLVFTKMQCLLDAPVKFFFVLTFPCIHRDSGSSNCRSGMVLG